MSPYRTTDQKMDRIEQISDQHQAQFSITRAPGVWIANARLANGQQFTVQSPASQSELLDNLLAAVERVIPINTEGAT